MHFLREEKQKHLIFKITRGEIKEIKVQIVEQFAQDHTTVVALIFVLNLVHKVIFLKISCLLVWAVSFKFPISAKGIVTPTHSHRIPFLI